MKIRILATLVFGFASLSGCSLTGRIAPLQYFTLNNNSNSCLKSVEISGPSHLLSEKIMLKKGEHSIGSVSSAYWIAPLQILLPEVLISSTGSKSINLQINELILNVDTSEVILTANAQDCSSNSQCQDKLITTKSKTSTETLDIIKSYQAVINQTLAQICS